jgi:hypothetical protein
MQMGEEYLQIGDGVAFVNNDLMLLPQMGQQLQGLGR